MFTDIDETRKDAHAHSQGEEANHLSGHPDGPI